MFHGNIFKGDQTAFNEQYLFVAPRQKQIVVVPKTHHTHKRRKIIQYNRAALARDSELSIDGGRTKILIESGKSFLILSAPCQSISKIISLPDSSIV